MINLLLVTGPVGGGKTAVVREAVSLLQTADIDHLAVDMDWLCSYWPWVEGDPHNRRAGRVALGVMVERARERGISHVLLAEVIETREAVESYRIIVGATDVKVALLTTPADLRRRRIVARGGDVERESMRAAELERIMGEAGVADIIVANDDRLPADVAREVLVSADWLR